MGVKKQVVTLQCKDIVEATSKKDIYDALQKQFRPLGLKKSAMILFRQSTISESIKNGLMRQRVHNQDNQK